MHISSSPMHRACQDSGQEFSSRHIQVWNWPNRMPMLFREMIRITVRSSKESKGHILIGHKVILLHSKFVKSLRVEHPVLSASGTFAFSISMGIILPRSVQYFLHNSANGFMTNVDSPPPWLQGVNNTTINIADGNNGLEEGVIHGQRNKNMRKHWEC